MLRSVTAFSLVILAVLPMAGRAQQPQLPFDQSAIRVELAFAKPRYCDGEPMYLNARITNQSSKPIYLCSDTPASALSVEVKKTEQVDMTSKLEIEKPSLMVGLNSIEDYVYMRPGQTQRFRLLVSRIRGGKDIPCIGNNVVFVNTDIYYRVGQSPKTDTFHVSQTHAIPVTFSKSNQDYLRQLSHKLRQDAIAAMDVIAVMPKDEALMALLDMSSYITMEDRKLLFAACKTAKRIPYELYAAIAQWDDPEAVRLLEWLWITCKSVQPNGLARHNLYLMLGSASERLKPLVKEVFVKHEGKLPEPAKIQVRYDYDD